MEQQRGLETMLLEKTVPRSRSASMVCGIVRRESSATDWSSVMTTMTFGRVCVPRSVDAEAGAAGVAWSARDCEGEGEQRGGEGEAGSSVDHGRSFVAHEAGNRLRGVNDSERDRHG